MLIRPSKFRRIIHAHMDYSLLHSDKIRFVWWIGTGKLWPLQRICKISTDIPCWNPAVIYLDYENKRPFYTAIRKTLESRYSDLVEPLQLTTNSSSEHLIPTINDLNSDNEYINYILNSYFLRSTVNLQKLFLISRLYRRIEACLKRYAAERLGTPSVPQSQQYQGL